jgi:transposase
MRFLKEKSSTFSMASRQFNIPAPSIVNLFDNFVRMPSTAYPGILMIDEFYSFRKQTKNKKYCCLLIDFETNNVIDIIEGRDLNAWHRYIQTNYTNNKLNVSFLYIDMFKTYRHIQRTYFTNAILVCDSFHVIKNVNKILIDERNKAMRKCEKGSINYYLLKKFRWLLT